MTSIGSFTIQYDSFESRRHYVDHFHNANEIIFIKEGAAEFLIAGKKYWAGENSVVFINNFESHKSQIVKYPYSRYFVLADQKYLHCCVGDPILLSVFKQRPSLFKHILPLNGETIHKVRESLARIYEEHTLPDSFSAEIIGSLFNLMITDLYRFSPDYFPGFSAGENYALINKVENYIENNFSGRITLSDTAGLFNCGMYYLSHLFKKITGYGFKEYLIYHRLSKAKEMLAKTNIKVSEICFHCGFSNVNHFIRMFKEKEGVTPLGFRKNHYR